MFALPKRTRSLGTHKVCGGTLVEMQMEQHVVTRTADCLCDWEGCDEQHEEAHDEVVYYYGCTGDCGAIRSVSVYAYDEQPEKGGRFTLPIVEDEGEQLRNFLFAHAGLCLDDEDDVEALAVALESRSRG